MLTLESPDVARLARRLRDLGFMHYLSHAEQPAMHLLVVAGFASHDLDSIRRYELTEAGQKWLAWLERQGE